MARTALRPNQRGPHHLRRTPWEALIHSTLPLKNHYMKLRAFYRLFSYSTLSYKAVQVISSQCRLACKHFRSNAYNVHEVDVCALSLL